MMDYSSYILEETKRILAIDSPTGYTRQAADYVYNLYKSFGYEPTITKKGGVLVCLNGEIAKEEPDRQGILVEAHLDTLGAMVAEITASGTLRVTPLGGLNANNAEAENCRIITRDGNVYEGTFQMKNASVHVNKEYSTTSRSFDEMEVVIDEMVSSKEEVEALGIMTGDIVCFEPRTVITKSGYIKSRFLDDKLSVGILLGYAKYVKENNIQPERKIYHHITVFEEVGHGGSASVPSDVEEILSVDMGCVGGGLACKEHQVSICAKDSGGPYHYDVVTDLINCAKRANLDFAVDVYPFYGSDAEAGLRAGYDVKHGLIGAGVYASHGYERSHKRGVENTFLLLKEYLG